MFGPWYETDSDCCQHMRQDGNYYQMIECVWLDATEKDKQNGAHEYVIVRMMIDIRDYSEEEMEDAISSYGYTMEDFAEWSDEEKYSLIAECIMEEEILRDAYVIGDADSFEEAKEKIDKYIKEN